MPEVAVLTHSVLVELDCRTEVDPNDVGQWDRSRGCPRMDATTVAGEHLRLRCAGTENLRLDFNRDRKGRSLFRQDEVNYVDGKWQSNERQPAWTQLEEVAVVLGEGFNRFHEPAGKDLEQVESIRD